MQFGLVEMGPIWYSLLGRLAALFIFSATILLFYFSIRMLIWSSSLGRYSRLLGQPFLLFIETGSWQGTYLASWRGTKRTEFVTVVEALHRGVTGLSPIPMTSMINQALDQLAAPFIQMAYHMKVLGWSACLVGLLGTMSEIRLHFRGMALTQSTAFYVLASGIERAIQLLLYGLAIGLACLWGSSLARSRLSFLHVDLSKRLLAASIKRSE